MKCLTGKKAGMLKTTVLAAVCSTVMSGNALAASSWYNNGKVLATGGVSMTDGAGGGGITPWATITGYGTRDGINGDLHYTYVNLPNYALNSFGGAIGFYDRFELSYSHDVLTTGSTFNTVGLLTDTLGTVSINGLLNNPDDAVGSTNSIVSSVLESLSGQDLSGLTDALGTQGLGLSDLTGALTGELELPDGTGDALDLNALVADATGGLVGGGGNQGIEPFNTTIKMDVFGAKVRLFGEAIYDSDNLIPQVALGGFYKKNKNKELLKTLGAADAEDWEAYVAATKIFFPINTLVNVTARYTSANQTGLVGFGGPDGNDKELRWEASLAYLLNKGTAIGMEYQQHGDNLKDIHLGNQDASSLAGTGLTPGLGSTLKQNESDWFDVFVAFFPSKNLSITMAYAMLGDITITPDQNGFYISAQASF